MKLKRICAAVMSVIMICLVMPMNAAAAASFTDGDFNCMTWDGYPGEVSIEDYTGSATNLLIPSVIRDLRVNEIRLNAFSNSASLESVSIPETVEYIGASAFSNCTSLETINIPSGVTLVENSTFSGCSSLESFVIPNNITSIGDNAFYFCTSLSSITIPTSVTTMGSYIFTGCANLSTVNLIKNSYADSYTGYPAESTKNYTGVKLNSFSLNNGSFDSAPTMPAIYDIGDSFPTPTRSGYVFDGWYTADGTSGEWGTKITSVSALNIDSIGTSVYAKWIATDDQSLILKSDGLYYGTYKLNSDGTLVAFPAVDVFAGTWGYTTGVLTLDGVVFSTTAATALDLSALSTAVTLNLSGSNSFVSTYNGSGQTSAIYHNQTLTITGDGNLTATGGVSTDSNSFGICCSQIGNVEITGGAVNATGGEAGYDSYGIYAYYDVNVSGSADVTAQGGTADENSYGIFSDNGNVSIIGGKLSATGGEANGSHSVGIFAYDVTVSGGSDVTAQGGTSDDNSYGIFANFGSVNISDSSLTAAGGAAILESYGINIYYDITVSDSRIILRSDDAVANKGTVTPVIAAIDYDNADGRAAVRVDNNVIDLTTIKYIKIYKSEAEYLRDYPPVIPESEPEPESKTPSSTPPNYPPIPPLSDPAPTFTPGEKEEFTTKSGITSTVTVTEDGVVVEAGLNESGSVNSESTAAAVKKAAEIAKANGETSITIAIPEGATGLSAATVQKLVKAANGMKIVLALTSIKDGEEVGSISIPINSKTGQILTELYFETERIYSAQNYIMKKWKTDILGSFETAQKGGWGDIATLTISLENLGFTADDGTKLYALIYDTKTGKWYQVPAEIEDGNVVIETKRTGVVTVVTDPIT